MTPLAKLRVVTPETPISEVLQTMEGGDINQVPVAKDGQFVGMVTRDHILQVLSANMELDRPMRRPAVTGKSTEPV